MCDSETGVCRLDSFYTKAEVEDAKAELRKDGKIRKRMKEEGLSFEDLVTTSFPLKYLGIEVPGKGSKTTKPRFSLAETVRLSLSPRSLDGTAKGLRMSDHRKAFRERFPDIDDALSRPSLNRLALDAASLLKSKRDFLSYKKNPYALAVRPALKELSRRTGVPSRVSLQVLRKGIAAFFTGHRPGMSAHGWARARLTSFVMKGCTHWFPDHLLVEQATNDTSTAFWSELDCLCRKRSQCGRRGKRTRSNAS